jgi:aminopeptidase N
MTTATLFDSELDDIKVQLADANRRLEASGREYSDLYHRHQALLVDCARRDREHDAATRRAVWTDVTASFDRAIRDRVAGGYRHLLRMVAELPATPQTSTVRHAAEDLRQRLDAAVADSGHDVLAAELVRIREAVGAQGRRWHRAHEATLAGLAPDGTCRCCGCELIRSIDTTPEA